MVVLVVGEHIERHQAEHGLHLPGVLGQVTGEVQQGLVVQFRVVNGLVEQGTRGGHMEAFAIGKVETTCGELFPFKQLEIRHFYAASAGGFVVLVFD